MKLTSIVKAIRSELERRAAARHLEALDDRALADFGISRSEISPAVRGVL